MPHTQHVGPTPSGINAKRILVRLVFVVPAAFTAQARAADYHWSTSSGVWNQPASWSPAAIPQSADNGLIDYPSGLARITSPSGPVASVTVLDAATVSISNQGSLQCNGNFIVGQSNQSGHLNVLTTNALLTFPGGLNVGGSLRVGAQNGTGEVHQDAGTVNVGNDVALGDAPGASTYVTTGSYFLSGTGAVRATRMLVGWTEETSGHLSLGGFASVNVQELLAGNIRYGGYVDQTGGTMNVSTRFALSSSSHTTSGVYTLTGGSLNCAATSIYFGMLHYDGGAASLGDVFVDTGTILISGGGNKVLRTTHLGIFQDDGRIDLADNSIVVTNDGPASLSYMVADAYGNGAWTSPYGITSSFAAATALLSLPHRTAVGYAPLGASGTLLKYTYAGDANVDRKVDLSDFTALAANFNGTNKLWYQGDFNYDQTVDLSDFTLLASNFNQTMTADAAAPASGGGSLEPQPSALTLVTLLGSRSCARRPRRSLPRVR